MGETITLTTKDGIEIGAYRARPTGTPRGGMVVVQEIFGVNHHIRSVADRFAAAGYLAVAPALFDRVEPNIELGYQQPDIQSGAAIRGKTELPKTLIDIEAAIAAARKAARSASSAIAGAARSPSPRPAGFPASPPRSAITAAGSLPWQ